MKQYWRGALFLLGLMAVLARPGVAQKRYDPLTQTEIDDLREAHEEPEQRLKLFIAYARARLTSMQEARANPKTENRGEITHEWLTDFLEIYDELGDNVDMYVERKDDFRKAMKAVIEADAEFQAKLLALKDAAGVDTQEFKRYQFVLSNAIESVDSGIEDHRKVLEQLEEAAKRKKKKK